MKRRDLILLWGIVIVFALLLGSFNKKDYLYQGGKDTHRMYGDGTYQMMTGHDDDGNIIRELHNCEYNEGIVYEINGITETEDFLYAYGLTYGTEVYAVVSLSDNSLKFFADVSGGEDNTPGLVSSREMLENGDLTLLSSFDEFAADEQEELETLKNGGGTEALDID